MSNARVPRNDEPPKPDREAQIDEMLEETFPASDPPTWDTVADAHEDDEAPLDPE